MSTQSKLKRSILRHDWQQYHSDITFKEYLIKIDYQPSEQWNWSGNPFKYEPHRQTHISPRQSK